ncbi:MAG: response regulator [Deltaproteobacteria bacterium]|jgi:signal transduction histidine kinase/CRP-like cAMP-binding protein/ActR/RegA family two-component response regulator|nr:response regulator [Deltaproteobacteria bacterium]MBT4526197.1 response regulator [Deltaproteobacteria bacterium]
MDVNYSSSEILKILNLSRLFKQFEDEQLMELISVSRVESFEKGEKILAEGSENDKVYILLEGKIIVYAEDEFILTLRRQGDIFGEMSVITKSLTTATVYADSAVHVFSISSSNIYESSGHALRSMIFKIFLDILIEKLTLTTNRVKGFQATSEELNLKKQELVQKTVILQSVLGSMSDGVVVTDSNGELLHVNEAFTQMISRNTVPHSFEDWPGELGLYQPDKKTLYRVAELPMLRLHQKQTVDSVEIFVKNKKLKKGIWLLANGSLLKSEDDSDYEGAVVVFRDYTKKKLEQEALIKAKEQAEAIAKSKTNFLSVISHELHTPLNGIIGMTDLLKTTQMTTEQTEYLETICESSDHLLSMIRNILVFNDLESGNLKLKSDSYLLKPLTDQIIKKYRPIAQQKDVAFTFTFDEQLTIPLLGDKLLVLQVLEHLVNNAIKFTKQGSVTIDAKSENFNNQEIHILLTISDTGIGISDADQENLFQAFSQVDISLNRQYEGTGMGLVITKRIVEYIGGNISVISQEGQGTTFLVRFSQKIPESKSTPSEKEKTLEPRLEDKVHPQKDTAIIGESPKILVAEDNKVNQKLISKVLKKLGYEAVIANNGKEAVDIFEKQAYKIILMDIQMPEMDGLEATQNILKKSSGDSTPKIIALTANVTEGIKEKCLEVGMCDYMSKPLRMDKLSEVLKKHQ